MLVDFIIIGAQKCGTTTLSEILKQHPGIIGSSSKEPHFFSEAKDWRGEIDKYHALFQKKSGALYFEASTSYTIYPYRNLHIWDDIYEYNPNMKFIYLVRNPFERIVSSYMHAYVRGHTDLKFEDALINKSFHIDVTRYFTQIFPYIQKFSSDNVLIIDFDELINSQDVILREISNFLSIDGDKFSCVNKIHSNKSIKGSTKLHHKFDSPSLPLKFVRKFFPSLWERIVDNSDRKFDRKPKLNKEHKELITNMLRLEIIELEKLMHKDLSHWFGSSESEILKDRLL